MAAPAQPVRASMLPYTSQAVIYYLRTFFTDVVVDAAPLLDDATHAALSACKYVVLVINPDVGSVQTTLGTLRMLAALNIPDAQIKIVLNQNGPEASVPQAAVEKALGRALDAVIPYEKAQATALAQGIPLVLSQPGAALVTAVAGFAAKLL
jgi:pilus assembly protein CpaE